MKKHQAFLVCAILFAAAVLQANPGRLVIVGGALARDNQDVHRAFIEAASTRSADGPILIVPSASGSPVDAARRFQDQLTRRGVSDSRILVLPLAVRDDPSTPDVDESA
jgi:cyanophycinase